MLHFGLLKVFKPSRNLIHAREIKSNTWEKNTLERVDNTHKEIPRYFEKKSSSHCWRCYDTSPKTSLKTPMYVCSVYLSTATNTTAKSERVLKNILSLFCNIYWTIWQCLILSHVYREFSVDTTSSADKIDVTTFRNRFSAAPSKLYMTELHFDSCFVFSAVTWKNFQETSNWDSLMRKETQYKNVLRYLIINLTWPACYRFKSV